MKRTFIRTKNVKRFVGLMEELQKLPPNIPKLALVYGEHGLGKSQTIQWWADKKLARYPHLCDRIYKSIKFESYNQNDMEEILSNLTELQFTDDAVQYLATRANQFRQLVKLVNRIEKLSETNEIKELDEYMLKGLLNERQNIKTLQKVG